MIKTISQCFIKPKYHVEEAEEPIYLTPSDLQMLPFNYIHWAHLFVKPQPQPHHETNKEEDSMEIFLDRLKESLSVTLVHFYPLAGQLEIQVDEDEHSSFFFINPNKGPGAKFIHATTTTPLTVSDILTPTDVSKGVQSFFDHSMTNYDGHEIPLLSIKVTELVDGVMIGCSANHVCVDGVSYWHFFNAWSEIFRSKVAVNDDNPGSVIPISRPPIHKRWFVEGISPTIKIPFTRRDEIVLRFESSTPPPLRERIFHFSAESVAAIKEKANNPKDLLEALPKLPNKDYYKDQVTTTFSSFQALTALVWRCITRARITTRRTRTTCLSHDDDDLVETILGLSVNTRRRLDPPLSENYFGNSIQTTFVGCKANDLLEQSLSWAAAILNRTVASITDNDVRGRITEWANSPWFVTYDMVFNRPNKVLIAGSPRFDVYGIEFGMGKAVAVFSGQKFMFDGKIDSISGRDGGGSLDLEICLYPHHMNALESDKEFMDWVS